MNFKKTIIFFMIFTSVLFSENKINSNLTKAQCEIIKEEMIQSFNDTFISFNSNNEENIIRHFDIQNEKVLNYNKNNCYVYFSAKNPSAKNLYVMNQK